MPSGDIVEKMSGDKTVSTLGHTPILLTNTIAIETSNRFQALTPGDVEENGLETRDILDNRDNLSQTSASNDQAVNLSSQADPENSMETLLKEIKLGFAKSEKNQEKIQLTCEALETKLNALVVRVSALENTLEQTSEEVKTCQNDISKLRSNEKELRDKVETLENISRCNNLRILNIPENSEGQNIKSFIIQLLKDFLPELDEKSLTEDIQRVHRDPFRLNAARKKPRRILINFKTYTLKECILNKALKSGILSKDGYNYKIRSDISKITADRQWALGNYMQELRNAGATVQLKFPALLKIMWNNQTFNIREPKEVELLLERMRGNK